MPERWVLNASPLIVSARISREDLFFALANEVVVPLAVASEIRAGPSEDRARQIVEAGRFRIAGDIVRLLKANGFRMNDDAIRAALKRVAGEEWTT